MLTGRQRPGFDDIDETRVRARRGAKWVRYGPDVLAAWVADMDFAPAPVVLDALHHQIDTGDLGYPADETRNGVREAFAARAAARWGWRVEPELVQLVPDVVRGIDVALTELTEPGAAVVITTPIYPPFTKVIRATGRRIVDAPLTCDDRLDLDRLAATFASERPGAMLLCSPHNPTGHVVSPGENRCLAELAAAHGVVVISDEIHADLVHDDRVHQPFAMAAAAAGADTITVTSASKAFNLAGLRCAMTIAGSARLCELMTDDDRHEAVGATGITATLAAWSADGGAWLARCREVLAENRATVADWARRWDIGLRSPDATYLAWLDFGQLPLGDNPARWLLDEAQVALSPGGDYGPRSGGFARLNFATSPALLGRILDRIDGALGRVR